MKLVSDLYNKTASFKNDEKGSIVPLTAIMITAMALAAGAAVDYSRYSSAKNIMNTALDAAILDAGVRLGEGQPVDQKFEDDFNAFFNVNIVGRGGFADDFRIVDFSADRNTGRVNASAAATLDTTLMQIGGIEKMDVNATSSGVFSRAPTEVSIMLDTTGSMRSNGKIASLRRTATRAVNALLDGTAVSSNTRVGIVPYASSVNIGASNAIKVTSGNQNTQIASLSDFGPTNNNVRPENGCVTERGGQEEATDASYTEARIGSDARSVNGNTSQERQTCPTLTIEPLTNDKSKLTYKIDRLDANGFTAGHIGLAWSYYMLSPNWNELWDTPNEPAEYSSNVNKVAIVMTDGLFNTAYNGVPLGENNNPFGGQAARSNNIAEQLCENMKLSGITIYTIGFALSDIDNDNRRERATNLLEDCATDNAEGREFFFNAENENQLADAFDEIVKDITAIRLTQ